SCPPDSAALICATVLLGVAMKKSLIGSEVPGVLPPAQETPCELVRFEGTNTSQFPEESMYRYGFSSTVGVVPTVVYAGKLCAGTPVLPTNTMFQFEPVQLPSLSLRMMNCCWVPELTWP